MATYELGKEATIGKHKGEVVAISKDGTRIGLRLPGGRLIDCPSGNAPEPQAPPPISEVAPSPEPSSLKQYAKSSPPPVAAKSAAAATNKD